MISVISIKDIKKYPLIKKSITKIICNCKVEILDKVRRNNPHDGHDSGNASTNKNDHDKNVDMNHSKNDSYNYSNHNDDNDDNDGNKDSTTDGDTDDVNYQENNQKNENICNDKDYIVKIHLRQFYDVLLKNLDNLINFDNSNNNDHTNDNDNESENILKIVKNSIIDYI
jgi:hypothetical protein